MRVNVAVGAILFLVSVAGYLLLSAAPTRVHVVTIGGWLLVVVLAALLLWFPALKPVARGALLFAFLFFGAWLLAFANTKVVLSYELNVRAYLVYVVLTALLLCSFFLATFGISKVLRLWMGKH